MVQEGFFHLLDIAVINSYTLFKALSNQPMLPILKFRNTLIGQLAAVQLRQKEPVNISAPTSTSPTYKTVTEFHRMENIPSSKGATSPCYLRCRICTLEKKRKETRYRCRDCENKPPLCPAPCFSIYHGHTL